MFTECPKCTAIYRVRAENLRVAMGMVRCRRCEEIFNALTTLRDEGQVTDAETLGQQLPMTRLGDRVMIDPKAVAEKLSADASTEYSGEAALRAVTPRQSAAPDATRAAAQTLPDEGSAAVPTSPGRAHARAPRATSWSWRLTALLATFSLAMRNLLRHRKRTALGLSAVTFGVAALLLASGFIEWLFWDTREMTIRARLGHIQVVRSGYFEHGVADPFGFLMSDQSPYLRAVAGSPHVEVVAPRLSFSGLVSHGDTTISFIGEGVDPVKEARVSTMLEVFSGDNLSAQAPDGIIMGAGLAANLGVAPGDTVVLLANTQSGGVFAVEARVSGLFRTIAKAFDDSALRVPIEMARRLMRVEGSHTWIVLLDETERTSEVLQGLRERLPDATSGLELVPWYDLAEFYNKFVQLFSKQVNVVRVIIAVVILVSISNTLIMSVLERTGEIGTLMALGLRRRVILQLFVNEGLLLGLAGSALGLGLGVLLAEVISHVGIPMPPPPNAEVGFTAEILVTAPLAATTGALAVGATALASLYPAWKASRLAIVDALRHAR